ncbi:NAD-dependent epimerase/dehydratase family protein [Vannielia litorea]|uniref:NAD-dependent epimerase/dehydratase family protein n=1 Tax=Vannielia litorea TaxID=1217970 RepID=UPI001C950655|nr:NAD-dependent epimerase/dehydratase family protein [Vannielia litorea]MBY6049380.1 NAD-dependent epimerase/dehydratase family protein [Vannielia litorea]MBY6076794.1 NAD-dependent epimerase/dehydratase family protein [Vannielia litorea]
MMKVVITGARGFIGQNLAHYFRSTGSKVTLIGIDRYSDGPASERDVFDQFHTGCFTSDAALRLAASGDAVVHLAAQASVQQSMIDPLGTFENNAARSHRLIDHLRRHAPHVHFVFASTGAVSQDEGPIDESATANPASPYGASKLATEALMAAYASAWDFAGVSLRFSNVYGPRSRRQGGVIPHFCRRLLAGAPLRINGDGGQTRDYIYVDDISRAIAGAVAMRAEGLYQLGTGVPTSLNEVVSIFRALGSGAALQVEHGPALCGEIRHNCANIARARADLGFVPRHSLRDGIARTFEWYDAELVS